MTCDNRWRAGENQKYYYVNDRISVAAAYDAYHPIDDARHSARNYFKTEVKAEKARGVIARILKGGWVV